jgi:hypothetical protein
VGRGQVDTPDQLAVGTGQFSVFVECFG